MVVVVEKSLGYIMQYLESTNKYEVKTYGEYVGATDALIYENEYIGEKFEDYQFNVRNIALQNRMEDNKGILIISSHNKSPKEIEKILDTRLYNNIF